MRGETAQLSVVLKQAATDKVNDLEFVAFVQRGLSPAVAGRDIAVQFDCNPVGFHAQGFDQGRQCEWDGSVSEFSNFPVDLELHGVYANVRDSNLTGKRFDPAGSDTAASRRERTIASAPTFIRFCGGRTSS